MFERHVGQQRHDAPAKSLELLLGVPDLVDAQVTVAVVGEKSARSISVDDRPRNG